MSKLNRLANANNEFQGDFKRVLCVCSAGMLRSPTAAEVLSREPFNFNTRAAGLSKEYALVQVDDVLLHWADEIVCMEIDHWNELKKMLADGDVSKPVLNLSIPDMYKFRDPELIKIITEYYPEVLNRPKEPIIERDTEDDEDIIYR